MSHLVILNESPLPFWFSSTDNPTMVNVPLSDRHVSVEGHVSGSYRRDACQRRAALFQLEPFALCTVLCVLQVHLKQTRL